MEKKEFKGTKGPWSANGLHVSSEKKPIGQSYIVNFKHDGRGRAIVDTEGYANAKLIAAAPELLEALQDGLELINYIKSVIPEGKVLETIEAFNIIANSAISKATD